MELSGKDASFVAYLSKFLYANGNEVLIGRKKLSLTSSVLCILSKLYTNPNNNVTNRVSNDVELRENQNFLLNVINNVIALKVTHSIETVQGGIDLSLFKSLLMLELKKTPIHLLLGLNELCSQLETLVCSCSISSLQELVGNKPVEWTALKLLNLSHNYLEGIQEDVRWFPKLQVIDVSHNRLEDATGLKYLTKVSSVNLGYNNLSKVPAFSEESFKLLRELSLRNNNLEDLKGLEGIRHLNDLDLSYNCLLEHSVLFPIQSLPYLQVLKLVGNPLSVQRLHRILTAKHLHPNVLVVGIKLDGHQLTKTEIGKVTQVRSISTCHSNINGGRIHTNSPLEEANILRNVTVSSLSYCPSTSSLDGCSVVSESSLKNDTESISSIKSDIKKRKSKSRKKKEIIIKDCGSSQQYTPSKNFPEKECKTKEFKATLAARRENLGLEWLSTYSTSLPSESILHRRITMPESREMSKKDVTDSQSLNNNVEVSSSIDKTAAFVSNAKEVENDPGQIDNEEVKKKISVTSDGIEVICSEHMHHDQIMSDDLNICKSCMQLDQDDDGDVSFQKNKNAYDIKYGISEENEDVESNIFLVEKKGNESKITIFVNIGEKYLNEEDVLTSDLLDSLDLSVLDNVEVLEKNAIKLDFKIFKHSQRERIYYAENEAAAEKMLNLLLPHADARNIKNIRKNALRCLKCDAQFTKNIIEERFISDIAHPLAKYILRDNNLSKIELEEKDICPVCESQMIVEDGDCPVTESFLKMANYSPAVISGYLFVPQKTSSVSMDTMSNFLLTFKHPQKVKQDTISSLSDEVTVNAADNREEGSNSDESSVCTALEYTSQELAANCSRGHSLDLTHSDNLNCCAKQLLCATQDPDSPQNEENLQDEDPIKLNNQNKIIALDMSSERSKDIYCEYMMDNTEEITYDTFTNLDHTLKLYIEMQLFNANEELEASIEAVLVSHSTTIKSRGLLLLSTKRLHFMKLAESLSEEPKNNVTPLEAVELHRLHTVLIFPGNQGASFMWGTEKNPSQCKGCYTCLFRDADYCCTFITYFSDFMKQKVPLLPAINPSSELNLNQVREDVLLAGAQNCESSNISTEILAFMLVDQWQLAPEKEHKIVALALTSTDICITDINFTKQGTKPSKFFKPVESYIPLAKQKVTNLVSVHPHFDTCKIGLHFLDEDSEKESLWMIVLKTRRMLYLLVNTIKEPWQENFGIEMKVETPVDCECNSY